MSVIAWVFTIVGGIAVATIVGMACCALKVASDADDRTDADDSYE